MVGNEMCQSGNEVMVVGQPGRFEGRWAGASGR
jgi:hypothetical protein